MSISPKLLILGLVAAIVAILVGGVLGSLSVPSYEIETRRALTGSATPAPDDDIPLPDARVHFSVSLKPAASLPAVFEQMRLARDAGVSRFIFDIDLPRTDEDRESLKRAIENLITPNSEDTFWLNVNCNPPTDWYDAHPEHTALGSDGARQPSVTSPLWLNDTKAHLTALIDQFTTEDDNSAFTGVVVRALRDGSWSQLDQMDTSPQNQKSFRLWLQAKYLDLDVLAAKWGIEPPENWDQLALPTEPLPEDAVFLDPATQAPRIDYRHYISEATTKTIHGLSAFLRDASIPDLKVYVTAGNILDDPRPDSGHPLPGMINVNLVDGTLTTSPGRTLAGFASTPPHTRLARIQTEPYFTGVTFNEAENAPKVPANYDRTILRQDMTRNAMVSALTGAAWAIPDPLGQGTFAYEPIWRDIAKIVNVRKQMFHAAIRPDVTPLTLVFDPDSHAYSVDGQLPNDIILDTLKSVARSGLPYTWMTLDELYAAPSNSQPLYIFLNFYCADNEKRAALNDALVAQQATAIWLYAPGLVNETNSPENMASLTGIAVEQRDPETRTGSKFAFTGTWITENQTYGAEIGGIPTYRVVDEQSDPLARYQDNDDISAAMKFHESGWTSIALLDPATTPEFLKDLIYILGVRVDFVAHITAGDPLLTRSGNLLVAYSEQDAEIRLEIHQPQDILNLNDETEAWYDRSEIVLFLPAGNTKVLHFQSSQDTP